MRLRALGTSLALVASVAAPDVAAAAVAAGSVRPASLPPGNHRFDVGFAGHRRAYLVHMPGGTEAGRRLPVVLNFHGGGSDAPSQEAYSQMDSTADRHGFIAIYPQGTGVVPDQQRFLTWNAGKCCGPAVRNKVDDVGFAFAVLDDLAARTPVDRARVYATGISNGGMMAYRLAVDASKRVAAVASVAGQLEVTKFAPSRPVPVMEFHSVDDPRALYDGGLGPPFPGTSVRNRFESVQAGIDRWVARNGCRKKPRVGATKRARPGSPDAGESVTRVSYTPCKRGTQVVLWKFTGSGHVWPGSTLDVSRSPLGAALGRPTTLVDANEVMWQFFSHHRARSR